MPYLGSTFALIVIVALFSLAGRRALHLAQELHARTEQIAALRGQLAALDDQLTEAAGASAQREQQRAHERDAVLDSLTDGVVTCDAEGRLTSMNRAGQAILGEGAFVTGETVASWAERVSLCYASGQPVPPGAVPLTRALRTAQALEPQEYIVTAGDGERRRIELAAAPAATGAVAVLQDVTALRRAQAQEAAANRRIESLVETSRRLGATQKLEEGFSIVAEGAHALLPAVPDLRVLLYEMESETRFLCLRAMLPEARAPRRTQSFQETLPYHSPFDAASPLLWSVYVSRETVCSGDVAADPAFAGAADGLALRGGVASLPLPRSVLVLPLAAQETVTGHLALTSGAPDAFVDPRLMDALTTLCTLAVLARTNLLLSRQSSQKSQGLNALWTVGEAAVSKRALADFADTLTEQARAVMGGEACTLSLFEEKDGARRLRTQGAAWRAWAVPDEQQVPCNHCASCDQVTQEAASTGEPCSLVGQPNPEFPACRWRALAGQSGQHSVLAVPLRSGEDILGALTVWVRGDRPFSPAQIQLLGTLAAFAVAAIRSAQSEAHEPPLKAA